MEINKQEIVEDIQVRLNTNDIRVKQEFIAESLDNMFDIDSISVLEHDRVVNNVVTAITEAHNHQELNESVYGSDDEIAVNNIPDITELNSYK